MPPFALRSPPPKRAPVRSDPRIRSQSSIAAAIPATPAISAACTRARLSRADRHLWRRGIFRRPDQGHRRQDRREPLARLAIRTSEECLPWMEAHGVRFQPSLSGTLSLSRTNAFFLGGGKALVNAYYRTAEQDLGVDRAPMRPPSPISILRATASPGSTIPGAGQSHSRVEAEGGHRRLRRLSRPIPTG